MSIIKLWDKSLVLGVIFNLIKKLIRVLAFFISLALIAFLISQVHTLISNGKNLKFNN